MRQNVSANIHIFCCSVLLIHTIFAGPNESRYFKV